jgi:L-threonylcarbamoyladenylate synthase
VVPEACAGLPSIAIRIPAHPVALDLIRAAGRPIAGPSANPYGRTSPTTAALVAEMLGDRIDMVLDGGPCTVGVESTVLDLTRTPAVVLRHGGVPVESIRQVAAVAPDPAHVPDEPARSPGQAASHYAPRLPVRLDATEIDGDEALLAFGPAVPRGAHCVRNLSPDSSLTEAGANLFRMMHELDRSGAARIAVMKIPDHGLGRAINDRLRRAAAPRPADVR